MNAKDLQIEVRRKEEEDYDQWLDWLAQQPGCDSRLMEHEQHPPNTKELSCPSLPPIANISNTRN